jgi:hypothetical protein
VKKVSLEELLMELRRKVGETPFSLAEIIKILARSGELLIVIILCLPFCQPIQIPGLSMPFGLVIAFIGWRMILHKPLWLPNCILVKKIAPKNLIKIIDIACRWIKKIRRWTYPRWSWVFKWRGLDVISGVSIMLLGLILALPLPIPFTNLTAGWAMFCISLGTLEKDGLFVFIGYSVFAVTIGLLTGIIIATKHALV